MALVPICVEHSEEPYCDFTPMANPQPILIPTGHVRTFCQGPCRPTWMLKILFGVVPAYKILPHNALCPVHLVVTGSTLILLGLVSVYK